MSLYQNFVQIGDVVRINDLCRYTRLHGATGAAVEGPIHESSHPWEIMVVLVNGELIKFRQGDTQLEVIAPGGSK